VKHDVPPGVKDRLDDLLRESGIALPEHVAETVLAHLLWVLEQNKTINLTAIKDPESAIRLHLVDSLYALEEVADSPAGLLCDIGSGGGFPGVPLGIATGRETLLVDSVGKKMRALQGFLEDEGLAPTLRTTTGRAEEIVSTLGASCAVVTMRAVSVLPSLVELAAPLLLPGGRLIALKGAIEEEELTRGRAAARLVGLKLDAVRRFTLPEGGESRSIVTFSAIGRGKIRLPRRTGLAQSKPLA